MYLLSRASFVYAYVYTYVAVYTPAYIRVYTFVCTPETALRVDRSRVYVQLTEMDAFDNSK